MPDNLEALAPFVAGQPVDRVALIARRNAQSAPQGLVGYSQKKQPAKVPARQPTLPELLLANAGLWMPKQEPGQPLMSLSPSNEDYININDLPPELTRVMDKNGRRLVGIQPSKIQDEKQRALLNSWIAARQMQREEMLAHRAKYDPRFQQQLAMLPPEEE